MSVSQEHHPRDQGAQRRKISVLGTQRECIAMLPSGMRWRWVTLVPLTIATSLIEAGAAAAVFALIKVISDPSQISRIPIVSAVVAALGISSPRSQVIAFTAIV